MIVVSRVLIWTMFILFGRTRASGVLATNCFFMDSSSTIHRANFFGPCGVITPETVSQSFEKTDIKTNSVQGFLMCCNIGQECYQDGICRTPGTVLENSSPFYIGGCTDPSFQDSSCSTLCCTFLSI